MSNGMQRSDARKRREPMQTAPGPTLQMPAPHNVTLLLCPWCHARSCGVPRTHTGVRHCDYCGGILGVVPVMHVPFRLVVEPETYNRASDYTEIVMEVETRRRQQEENGG